MMALTYRALAALLNYPTPALQQAIPEIAATLAEEAMLPAAALAALRPLLERLAAEDIYAAQERYHMLFDRSRTLSLHLFEHVHGESRDRGQAMVDLLRLYEEHDLTPRSDELPDFLPLFLEFLSLLPAAEARALLREPAGILAAIAARLGARDAAYAGAFQALLTLAETTPAAIEPGAVEDPNDLAALDAAWEEAAVRFGPGDPGDGCSTARLAVRLRAGQRDVRLQENVT
jgi:nitrate reductase delta subunit